MKISKWITTTRYKNIYWARYVKHGMKGSFESFLKYHFKWCTDIELKLTTNLK